MSGDTLKSDLLADITRAAWRGEVSLVRRYGCPSCRASGQCQEVADALFALVREGRIEWFGAEGDGSRPLRYRLARPIDWERVECLIRQSFTGRGLSAGEQAEVTRAHQADPDRYAELGASVRSEERRKLRW